MAYLVAILLASCAGLAYLLTQTEVDHGLISGEQRLRHPRLMFVCLVVAVGTFIVFSTSLNTYPLMAVETPYNYSNLFKAIAVVVAGSLSLGVLVNARRRRGED